MSLVCLRPCPEASLTKWSFGFRIQHQLMDSVNRVSGGTFFCLMAFLAPVRVNLRPHLQNRPFTRLDKCNSENYRQLCPHVLCKSIYMKDDASGATDTQSDEISKAWKGFGPKPAKRKKSVGQTRRERAAAKYDEMKAAGMPEYSIWIRLRGEEDKTWYPVGSMTVPRSSQISEAIYANEEALLKGTYRLAPRLRRFDGKKEFEYGYQLKEFPDEEIRVAEKPSTEGLMNFLQRWIGKLTNPLHSTEN